MFDWTVGVGLQRALSAATSFYYLPKRAGGGMESFPSNVQGLERSPPFTLRTYGLDRCVPIGSEAFRPP
jgi:hypothetical protein